MAFALTPQDVAWIDAAPVRIDESKVIPARPDDVFATLADHGRWPQWYPGMRKVEILGPASGVGALRAVWVGPVRAEERFIAWEPGRRFSFTLVSASAPGLKAMTEDLELEPTGDGSTRARYRIGIEGPAALAVLRPLLQRVGQRMVAGGLSGLAGTFA